MLAFVPAGVIILPVGLTTRLAAAASTTLPLTLILLTKTLPL